MKEHKINVNGLIATFHEFRQSVGVKKTKSDMYDIDALSRKVKTQWKSTKSINRYKRTIKTLKNIKVLIPARRGMYRINTEREKKS